MNPFDKLINTVLEKGGKITTFSIIFPDGTIKKAGKGKDKFVIKIKSKKVYLEVIKKGQLGIGEQYMLGNIDLEGDIYNILEMLHKINFDNNPTFSQKFLFSVKTKLLKNERHNSLKNVSYHYDLGNEFYEKWLDTSMTYSCAYFKSPYDTLDQAQEQKLDHICKKLMLKRGETLLDIGSGWGSMLILAAQKYKVKGYGITLSKEQLDYANKKVKKLGLSNLIKFELKDYRDIEGKFDKLVSIGMFEHVGKEYHDAFFKKVKEVLKPQGLGLVHTIGVDQPFKLEDNEWALKYIFPGGYLPCPVEIFGSSTKYNLVTLDLENLRPHYALTLKHWLKNYEKVFIETAKTRGLEFARMWRLYLNTCAAAFEFNGLRLYQLTFSNGINNDLPLTRDYIYK